jgi:hypothetical protein
MDLESVTADLAAAETTAKTNRVKIAQSREIVKRLGETLDRIRHRTRPASPSPGLLEVRSQTHQL